MYQRFTSIRFVAQKMPSIGSLLYSRCWNYVTICVLFVTVTVLSIPAAEGARYGSSELEEPEPGAMYRSSGRETGSPKRIDACFCCANKQLSFCCSACMERGRPSDETNQLPQRPDKPSGSLPPAVTKQDRYEDLPSLRMSAAERVLSSRIKTLRVSACSCCQRSGGRSRNCCLWCGAVGFSG